MRVAMARDSRDVDVPSASSRSPGAQIKTNLLINSPTYFAILSRF